MKTLAQDADNDIYLEGHDLKVVSGVDAYAVIISDAVRTVNCNSTLVAESTTSIPYSPMSMGYRIGEPRSKTSSVHTTSFSLSEK